VLPSEGFNPRGKFEKTQRARGNGCRCDTEKATAIEIVHF
jgi:hypothetical protein